MNSQEAMKGIDMGTTWTELKAQPVKELGEKALGPLQPEKYGEPMRDPEFADILDELESRVVRLECFKHAQLPRSAEREGALTELVFRACEGSRRSELDGPPLTDIATAQLQRTITLHDRALRRIRDLKPADAKVATWLAHIQERRDVFAKEHDGRAPSRLLSGFLDQFESDIRDLAHCAPAVPPRSQQEETHITELALRICEHTHDVGFLSPQFEEISTEQLARIIDMHKQAAEKIAELKPVAQELSGVERQIKERRDLFARVLKRRESSRS